MSSFSFTVSSVLSSGEQTFNLATLIHIPTGSALPAVLVLSAYDRDVYAGAQSFDYGKFSSPGGGNISAGTQNHPTILYFDLKDGVYVSRATGEPISAFTFTSSGQDLRSVYLSLYTNDSAGASYVGNWIDTAWQHQSDIDVVTRTHYVDATPNMATPAEIAAIAKSFIGQVWNDQGCWLLTSNISAAAGASLPVASAVQDTEDITGNGQWDVVYNGARQHEDWRALLQVGDIVSLGWITGKAHIATVTSGSGHNAMWVDNSGVRANDGTSYDIIIDGEHSVDDATVFGIDNTVVVFRLNGTAGGPSVQATPVAPPQLSAHDQSVQVGHALPLASLFSERDPNLLQMSSYQVVAHGDAAHVSLGGATNLASAAQQAAGIVIVAGADLAKVSVVAGLGPAQLTITAFDGQAWGSTSVTLTGWVDPPPQVAGSSIAVHATSQAIALDTLFSVSVPSAHAIVEYRFRDPGATGQLALADKRLNLATNEENAQGIIRVKAGDLDTVIWRAKADTGTVLVSAFDGVQWSDFGAVTIEGQNHAPKVTPLAYHALVLNQPVSMASLFALSDADNDAVTYVTILDFFDNVHLNGAIDYCPFPHAYEVSVAELSKVTYTPSTVGGPQGLTIQAYDGTSYSALTGVLFNVVDVTPLVRQGSAPYAALGQTVPLAQLFAVVDPDGKAILSYRVQDPSGGGSVHLNGASNLASSAEQAQGIAVFAAADLSKVSYQAGSVAGSEPLVFGAYDGALWGSNAISIYSSDSTAPSVYAPPVTLDLTRTVALGSLFSASAPSGRPIVQYLIRDPGGAGSLLLGGAHDLSAPGQQGQGVLIAAADLSKVQYKVGASEGNETLAVSVFDGVSWAEGDILVTARNYGRSVITPASVTLHAGQAIPLHNMFSVFDANGSAITGYQVNDTEHRIALNGVENFYAKDEYKGVYGIDNADINKVSYVAGEPGTHTIFVEVSNKAGLYSLMEAITITVLSNPVISPSTLSVTVHQSVALVDLFSAANPTGKPLLEYRIESAGIAGSLYLNGAANLASAAEQALGIAIVAAGDIGKLRYSGADAFHNDVLTIGAYDGESWGSATVPVTTIDGTAPLVTGAGSGSVELNHTVPLASLFTASAHSGLPITQYKIVDPNGGGKLVLNGATNGASADQQAQQGMAIIAAADLARIEYVGGERAGSETLTISAFDGQSWGSAYLSVASVKTDPPVVHANTTFVDPGHAVPITQLFSVDTPSGQAPAYYVFQDASGQIALNGAVNLWAQQQSAGYYWIAAADIGKVSYVAAADGVHRFTMIVNDGLNFSAWTSGLAVAGQERLALPPQVAPGATSVALGQPVALARVFAVSDPLGKAITQYSVLDPAGGGSVQLGGALDLASASEHAQGIVVFAAADLPKVQYLGAAAAGTEALAIGAYDGRAWGSAQIALASAVLPPQVSAAATTIELNQLRDASSLFSVAAMAGSAIVDYKFQDPSGGGQLMLNGATNLASLAQQAQGISIVSALELGRVQYSTGATIGSETLLVSAFDGASWGTANIAIATVDNRAPLVVQSASTVDLAVIVELGSLFKGVSVSGKPVLEYLITDPSGGGRVMINSAHDLASAAQKSAGITVVSAFDLQNLLYKGADSAATEALLVTAYDGQNSTSVAIHIDSVKAQPPALTPTPITIHVGDQVHMADLVAVAPANGHAITFYRVLDGDLGIHLNGATNIAASSLYDYSGIYDFNNAPDWGKITYSATTPGVAHITVQVNDGFNGSNVVDQVITVVAQGVVIEPLAQVAQKGGAANDSFKLGAVPSAIDGGAGIDTAVYGGAHSAYSVSVNVDGSVTVHGGAAGVNDKLVHVERIRFDDGVYALDISDKANTSGDGAALATAGQVFRLYQAAFDRAPDLSGLAFWVGNADAGTTLGAIAHGFTASQEFRDGYGRLTDHQFVEQMYQNILHRSGDAGGLAFWENALDHHVATREDVLIGFADSAENQVALIGVVQHGILL
ncbi:MAG: DUF4214 domain-containing protein [Pseudomonadota bacterium]